MIKPIKAFIIATSIACLPAVNAQQAVKTVTLQKESGLENQTRLALATVSELLDQNKPEEVPSTLNRRAAMHILDGVLHDTRFDGAAEVRAFVDDRCAKVIADLDRPLRSRAEIYKLYNSGMIVRTEGATVAFDICRGAKSGAVGEGLISDSTAKVIADKCDMLLLTHNHSDHVDPVVIDYFLDKGKKVVAPTEILPDNKRISHERKEKVWSFSHTLADGSKISASVLPGHQDHLQNNIYIVTMPDGFRMAFTGDQWLRADDEWLLALKGRVEPVDVLMPICWARELQALVDVFDPAKVVSIHENEFIFHGIDHRESYWLSEAKLQQLRQPSYLLTIGEKIDIK